MKSLIAAALLTLSAAAQPPKILKIDPPNWWAQFPKPMLLIRGEDLTGATFGLSDHRLKLETTRVSPNGHWAELWLNRSPTAPETVTVTVKTPSGTVSAPYRFDRKRAENEGFAGFNSTDVLYLLMTDRFADGDLTNDGTPVEHAAELAKPRGWHGGDLRGIQNHINYLHDLGVTTVWITPVYQNHGQQSYHGYGATDMYAVDEHFGTVADLRGLAAHLHKDGLKLVLDTVPNHVGSANEWVFDSPEPDWFHGTAVHHTVAQGDFKPLTDPHAPWRDQRNVTEGWFANVLPDLNQENSTVSRYLIQNAIWWTEKTGADGLRLDTFPYVARSFWRDFHAELHTLFPHLTTVGEVFNPDPITTSSFAGGVTRNGIDTGLDTPFDFPTYSALREVLLRGAPMTRLADVLRQDTLYPHPERLVPFLGNHDTTRFLSQPGATLQRLQVAFTILATMRGMPQIYSGDEIAMRGGEDPDNRRDFPGGFLEGTGATRPNAFDPSGRTPEQQETFAALQRLLAIRRTHPAFQRGEEQILHADADTLVYVRTLQGPVPPMQRALVAIHGGLRAKELTIDVKGTALESASTADALLGPTGALTITPTGLHLRIGPDEAVIAEVR